MSNRTPSALEQFYMMQIMWNGTLPLQPKRPTVNFIGGTVSDDPVNNKIDVTLSGGGGGGASLGANFTQPAVWQTSGETAVAVVQVTPNSAGYSAGTVVFMAGGGFYLVTAVPDGTHLTLGNLGLAGAATPGATVTSGVLVLLTGPPAPLIQVGGSAVAQRRVIDFEGFATVDDGANDRTKIVNSAAQVTTTASFAQPAIGASVAVSVTSSAGHAAGAWATVAGGGRYTVAAVPDTTHLTLVNRGGPGNASAGATVASGAAVSLAATDPVEVLTSTLSPFSIRTHINVLDPRFGADPTGTVASTAAFNAAIAASIAAGSTLYIPAGTYLLDAEVTIPTTLHVVGDSDEYVLVKASAAMRSLFWVQDTECLISGIQFQCAGNAKYGILLSNAAQTTLDDVTVNGAIFDPWRVQGYLSSATITTGTQTGSGPALTVSQPDPLYNNIGGTTLRIKITLGGALGTATFQVSQDGGTTYTGVDQILFAATAIAMMAPPSVATDSGLRITAPAGTYVLGTTYDFSIVPGEGGVNEGITVRANCSSRTCGTTWATAGIIGTYTGSMNVESATGTATWTAGSPYVSIPGGALLAKGGRDGDFIRLPGAKFPLTNRVVPQQFCDVTAIACVLSDSLIAIDPGNLPTVGGTATDYALGIGTGAGFIDPHTGKENDQFTILGGHYSACPVGFRDGALNCGSVNDAWFDDYGFVGIYIGTEFSD